MAASRSPRDDLDLSERLSRLDAAAISDAGKSLRILPPAIRPVSANARLMGRAVTADAHDDLPSVLAGLQAAGPGDVLVVSANGSGAGYRGAIAAETEDRDAPQARSARPSPGPSAPLPLDAGRRIRNSQGEPGQHPVRMSGTTLPSPH